jgi:hypothetical protein
MMILYGDPSVPFLYTGLLVSKFLAKSSKVLVALAAAIRWEVRSRLTFRREQHLNHGARGPQAEIMQAVNRQRDSFQRARERGLGSVCIVHLAGDRIHVDFGLERAFNKFCSSADHDGVARPLHTGDGQLLCR